MLKPGKSLRARRKYQITKFLESGGFSDLYLGLNKQNNHKIVIKILKNSEFDNSHQAEEYWRRERAFINIQSKYSPDTLKLIDSFIDRFNPDTPKFVLVTNYIQGMDFTDWFDDYCDKDPPHFYRYLVKNIFLPLCDYFIYIHSHGLLHRDFSPSNIMVKTKGKVIPVVIDWGASLNFDPGKLYDKPPLLKKMEYTDELQIYTPGYAPPEVNEGKGMVPQSDIYSFGGIMYYCFTKGQQPDEDDPVEDTYLTPQDINEDCPDELEYVVERCTRYEPRDRFISFEEVKMELKRFVKKYSDSKSVQDQN